MQPQLGLAIPIHLEVAMEACYRCKSGPCAETMLEDAGCFAVTDLQGQAWLCREISHEEMGRGLSVGEALAEYILPGQRAARIGNVGPTVERFEVCERDELPEALCVEDINEQSRPRRAPKPQPLVCAGGPYDGVVLFAAELNRRCVIVRDSPEFPMVFMPNRSQWEAPSLGDGTARPTLDDARFSDRVCYRLDRSDPANVVLVHQGT